MHLSLQSLHRVLSGAALIVFCLILPSASQATAAQPASPNGAAIKIQITAQKSILPTSDNLEIEVSFTNTSHVAQPVLKYGTPFVAIQNSLFNVSRDGVSVPYLGALVKRGPPGANDYFVLQPGKAYTSKVKLARLYDLSITGDYQISYRPEALSPLAAPTAQRLASKSLTSRSETVSIFIQGRYPRGTPSRALAPPRARALANINQVEPDCNGDQARIIATALDNAQVLANQSVAYFAAGNADLRYKIWFGDYQAVRYARAKEAFDGIRDSLANRVATVSCSCDPGALDDPTPTDTSNIFAYVIRSQAYRIHICPAFWRTSAKGTDSQSGVMLHEMSHFADIANTRDYAYGQDETVLLGLLYPNLALINADSYEYFAENTPGSPSALFKGVRNNYSIAQLGAGFTVTDNIGLDGIQYFSSITRLQFADLTVALDLEGNAGKAFRIYRAAFDRLPDLNGLGFWIDSFDRGVSLQTVAEGFIKSQEFQNLYGSNPSAGTFLTKVYANVLHRAPDPGGYQYWLDILNRGVPKAEVLAAISESAENKGQVLAGIVNGISYNPYRPALAAKSSVFLSPFRVIK